MMVLVESFDLEIRMDIHDAAYLSYHQHLKEAVWGYPFTSTKGVLKFLQERGHEVKRLPAGVCLSIRHNMLLFFTHSGILAMGYKPPEGVHLFQTLQFTPRGFGKFLQELPAKVSFF